MQVAATDALENQLLELRRENTELRQLVRTDLPAKSELILENKCVANKQ